MGTQSTWAVSQSNSNRGDMLRLIVLLTWAIVSSSGEQELPTFVDPVLYTKSIYASLKATCPSGIKKCECLDAKGTFSDGPFDPDEDPINALITYVGCGPGYCYCKDNPEKEVDIRPQLSSTVLDLCPRNELNRCLCQDGKTRLKPPFDLLKVHSCRPKKCKCNGSETVMVNQGYGCKKGGYSDCPNGFDDFICKDGTQLSVTAIMKSWITASGEQIRSDKMCACPDGIIPKCRSTGKWFSCPKNGSHVNGDQIDFNLGNWQSFKGCKVEDWKLPKYK